MKTVTIVGARPQFVKAAAVSRVLRAVPGVVDCIVHTGQHYDAGMSDVFFSELGIPAPAYHLGIGSLAHGAQTGRMLEAIEAVLVDERPDWVVIYGDTNSTLAGALAAAKLHRPVAHVEAGLRSFNRRMPEEVNRVLADHASQLLFAPTDAAVRNLKREGIADAAIAQVGDVMYDAVLRYRAQAQSASRVHKTLGLRTGDYLLATIHRAENTDAPERLRAIVDALSQLSQQIDVVLPLHPRTRRAAEQHGIAFAPRLKLIEPVGYLDMVMLEEGAKLIATDSGGVQKEAFFFGVPCVTLRDETEWVELVDAGWNRLVAPTDAARVTSAIRAAIDAGAPAHRPANLYGDGRAAQAIVDRLLA